MSAPTRPFADGRGGINHEPALADPSEQPTTVSLYDDNGEEHTEDTNPVYYSQQQLADAADAGFLATADHVVVTDVDNLPVPDTADAAALRLSTVTVDTDALPSPRLPKYTGGDNNRSLVARPAGVSTQAFEDAITVIVDVYAVTLFAEGAYRDETPCTTTPLATLSIDSDPIPAAQSQSGPESTVVLTAR